MWLHRLADALDVGLAETGAEAAADNHVRHVEQVDRRRDAGAERLDSPVDQLGGHRILSLEGPGPDARLQAGAVALLHDLEQVGLVAALVQVTRAQLHGPAPGVGLEAAPAPTRALGAVDLDHHVPELAGGAAALPLLAVEHQPSAHPGPPPHPEQRLRALGGA